MAKFLNTSGTSYHLETLIKSASERLVLISPYLQLSDRIKELLEDKNRLKIDVRLVYGKNQLKPEELAWLNTLDFVRPSFCKNLHAKCYLNESECIITSLNLYEFSQVNNNEMGVLISREQDEQLYMDTYEEVQRLIRISETQHITKIPNPTVTTTSSPDKPRVFDKITTAKLAEKLNMSTGEFTEKLEQLGYITIQGKNPMLTDKGRQAGGEVKKGKFGYFIVWAIDLDISIESINDQDATQQSLADKLLSLFKF